MSGYIIKVTIENTHPPVWRRLTIPEKITFKDLHHIMQVIFSWDNGHLHDFSFPNTDEKVGTDSRYCEFPEDKTVVDAYLQNYKWIRYTYDFGDNWEHKIVLEEKDDTYERRYATVLKYKGDNFEEDCGGVYTMYEDYDPSEDGEDDEMNCRYNRPVFSLGDVNIRLEKMNFPVSKYNTSAGMMRNTDTKLNSTMNGILKNAEKQGIKMNSSQYALLESIISMGESMGLVSKKSVTGNLEASVMTKMVDTWFSFYDLLSEQPDNIIPYMKKESKNEYRQMSLLETAFSYEKEHKVDVYYIEKAESNHTWLQLLSNMNDKQAKDYYKYLRLPDDNTYKTEDYIHAVYQELQNHPEYLLYVIQKHELEELQTWNKYELGVIENNPDINAVSKWISLGLAEVDIVNQGKKHIANIRLAKDIKDILENIASIHQKKEYQWIERSFQDICSVVDTYGLIGFEECERIYHKQYQSNLTGTEFERLIYWHGRMIEEFQTATLPDGIPYVAMADTNVLQTMSQRDKLVKNLPYREYTTTEWKQMTKYFGSETPFWNSLYEILKSETTLSDEELQEYFQEWNWKIRGGETLDDIDDDLIDILEDNIARNVWTQIYLCMLNIIMHTSVKSLKGYSRYSLWKNYQKPLNYLPYYVEEYLLESVDEIRLDTELAEMPVIMQSGIFEATQQESVDKAIRKFDEIKNSLDEINIDFQFLFFHILYEAKELGRAEAELMILKRYLEKQSIGLYDQEIMEIDANLQYVREGMI